MPGFFDRLELALDPDSGDAIAFARYMPETYLLDGVEEEDARARAMVGLLRSGPVEALRVLGLRLPPDRLEDGT